MEEEALAALVEPVGACGEGAEGGGGRATPKAMTATRGWEAATAGGGGEAEERGGGEAEARGGAKAEARGGAEASEAEARAGEEAA